MIRPAAIQETRSSAGADLGPEQAQKYMDTRAAAHFPHPVEGTRALVERDTFLSDPGGAARESRRAVGGEHAAERGADDESAHQNGACGWVGGVGARRTWRGNAIRRAGRGVGRLGGSFSSIPQLRVLANDQTKIAWPMISQSDRAAAAA